MFKALLNAARRQPLIAALLLVALALCTFLLVRMFMKKEGLAEDGPYKCNESWATCQSKTDGTHCYWGGSPANPSTKGMCCKAPWSNKSDCSAYAPGRRRYAMMYEGEFKAGNKHYVDLGYLTSGQTRNVTIPGTLNGLTSIDVADGIKWKLCDKSLGCMKEWLSGSNSNVGKLADAKYNPEKYRAYDGMDDAFNWNDHSESVLFQRA